MKMLIRHCITVTLHGYHGFSRHLQLDYFFQPNKNMEPLSLPLLIYICRMYVLFTLINLSFGLGNSYMGFCFENALDNFKKISLSNFSNVSRSLLCATVYATFSADIRYIPLYIYIYIYIWRVSEGFIVTLFINVCWTSSSGFWQWKCL